MRLHSGSILRGGRRIRGWQRYSFFPLHPGSRALRLISLSSALIAWSIIDRNTIAI